MVKKQAIKNRYSAISITKKVAKRFRSFSKKISKSHSDSLVAIMNFFEWHGFLPSDRFEKSVIEEIAKNRKRTEASIAIIKDIEKSQTKPTNAMLLSLFEEKITQEEPDIVEVKFSEPETPLNEETTVPKIRYDRLAENMDSVLTDFEYVLNNVKMVKGGFGKGYLKLELSEEEIIRFKRNITNIKLCT